MEASPVGARRFITSHAVSRFVNRYVDLGVNVPFASGLNALVQYSRRPWESEAVSLAGRRETR